jgi:hypothetical protein
VENGLRHVLSSTVNTAPRIAFVSLIPFLLFPSLSFAASVDATQACAIKKQFDDAKSEASKAEQELLTIQTASGARKFKRLDKAPLEQDLATAMENFETAKQTLADAEQAVKDADKAQAEFDTAQSGGLRITEVKRQLAVLETTAKQTTSDLWKNKAALGTVSKIEGEIKTMEAALRAQMSGLDVNDVDLARTQIDNDVAEIGRKVKMLEKRATSMKARITAADVSKAEIPSPGFGDVKMRCPAITVQMNRIAVSVRGIDQMFETWLSEKDADQRAAYANKIAELEEGVEKLQQDLLPAAEACRTSLLADLGSLSAKRSELQKADPDEALRKLREKPKTEAKEREPLDRELKRLNADRRVLETKVTEAKRFSAASLTAQDAAKRVVDELSKHLDLLAALDGVDELKADYAAVEQLKNDELTLANTAVTEANTLLNNLSVTRAQLRTRVAAWKTAVTNWKAKVAAFKEKPDPAVRTTLQTERDALRKEKAELVAINEACQKKSKTGESLRSTRASLKPFDCFQDVMDAIGELDKAINGLLASAAAPAGEGYGGSERLALFPGFRPMTVALGYTVAGSNEAVSVPATPTTGGAPPMCAPLEDLEMELEELPPAEDWSELTRELAEVEAKALVAVGLADKLPASVSVSEMDKNITTLETRVTNTLIAMKNAAAVLNPEKPPATVQRCQAVNAIRERLEVSSATANQAAQELSQELEAATTTGSLCATAADAEQIRAAYRSAIRGVAEIGRLEKQAASDRNALGTLQQESAMRAELVKEMTSSMQVIDQLEKEAAVIYEDAGNTVRIFRKKVGSARDAHLVLRNGLQALYNNYRILDRDRIPIPAELIARIGRAGDTRDTIGEKLYQLSKDDLLVSLGLIFEALSILRAHQAEARLLLQSSQAGVCDFDRLDTLIEQIGATLSDASFELGLAADLPKLAEKCDLQARCTPLLQAVRNELQRDALESAQARAQEARNAGCDLGSVNDLLKSGHSAQEASRQLADAGVHCHFTEGLQMAQTLSAAVQQSPAVATRIAEIRSGAQAQQQVEQLITQATNVAVQGSNLSRRAPSEQAEIQRSFANAEGLLNQASQVASNYRCLVDRVNRYRREYEKLKESAWIEAAGATPPVPVDEVPDVLGTPSVAARSTPTVPATPSSPAVLTMVGEPIPSPKFGGWITVEDGHMELVDPAYKVTAKWDPMPTSLPREGRSVTLTITASAPNLINTGIQIRGGGVTITRDGAPAPDWGPEPLDLAVTAANGQAETRSMTVTIKPGATSAGSTAWITVGVFYGLKVEYNYRGTP